jgi:hypothetical protein
MKPILSFVRLVPTSLVSTICALLDIIAIIPDAISHFSGANLDNFLAGPHVFMGIMFAISAGLIFLKTAADEEHVFARYRWQLLAKPYLFLSFVLDGLWHTHFGFETDLDVINSITHIMMAVGITISVMGPILAIWEDLETKPLFRLLKTVLAVVSGGLVVLFLGLFFNLENAMFHLPATNFVMKLGTLQGNEPLLLADARSYTPTLLFFGVFFVLIKRWKLFPGAGTLFSLLSLGLMALTPVKEYGLKDHTFLFPVVLVVGISIDVLLPLLQPGKSAWRTILFAALVPLLWWGSYLYFLNPHLPILWSMSFITGFAALPAFLNALLGLAILSRPPQTE